MTTKRSTAATKQSRKLGRPSTYTRAIADEICRRIAEGEPLTKICKDPKMPAYRTVLGWRVSDVGDGEFSHMYARSREDAADTLADEIREIGSASNVAISIRVPAGSQPISKNGLPRS